jgi:hypothetical protein
MEGLAPGTAVPKHGVDAMEELATKIGAMGQELTKLKAEQVRL